ncbi:MAG: Uncharacterised protein [Candidatus Nitrosopelagicus brevis]|mgnify:FL=1|jgi:large subunit ribosomal protein L32e|nr:50S ribosomal protein L32e [Candidatus Nitrosopelagicus sp.]MEC7707550.1 50S ribosomal protein L32e [Thermoproteota archaeon]CAI8182152.1 MAG: Uncharacterised protein [Candidatus Nitrosopelagicus brevis]MEC9435797.1 50S ribosomal protein L32e [Thermoproteota archaeon]MED5282614.1 50S ribosomal protein L32e [Thermoproteota archaeon]|tara:strand:+ start:453 stop:851 length:399 start_codon:yes stop_codon:yes gene_type:complete
MPINKEKLQAREEARVSRPEFIRPESWRYVRLESGWRKPKGMDNHQRKQKSRGRPGLVKVGYGTPKIALGLHPSGYTDNLVHNANDLKNLNPKEDGIRFGHSVGAKKRREIMKIALEKKFKVFNARVSQNAS